MTQPTKCRFGPDQHPILAWSFSALRRYQNSAILAVFWYFKYGMLRPSGQSGPGRTENPGLKLRMLD